MSPFSKIPVEILTLILSLLDATDIDNFIHTDFNIKNYFNTLNHIILLLTIKWGTNFLTKRAKNLKFWSVGRFLNIWKLMFDIQDAKYFKNSSYTGYYIHQLFKKKFYVLDINHRETQLCIKHKNNLNAWTANATLNVHDKNCTFSSYRYHFDNRDNANNVWLDFHLQKKHTYKHTNNLNTWITNTTDLKLEPRLKHLPT